MESTGKPAHATISTSWRTPIGASELRTGKWEGTLNAARVVIRPLMFSATYIALTLVLLESPLALLI